jgi:hypothetical protein
MAGHGLWSVLGRVYFEDWMKLSDGPELMETGTARCNSDRALQILYLFAAATRACRKIGNISGERCIRFQLICLTKSTIVFFAKETHDDYL